MTRKRKTPVASSFKDFLAASSRLCRSKVGSIFEQDSADLAVTGRDIGKSAGTCYMAVQRALCGLPGSFAAMGDPLLPRNARCLTESFAIRLEDSPVEEASCRISTETGILHVPSPEDL